MRELERRIEAVEAHNSSGEQRELPEAPAGVPDSFTEHMKLLFDIQVLALQSDMTRMITFKTGRDAQNRVFQECESQQPFHPSSHHGNREERIMEFNKINKFRVGQMAYFLEKMKSTMDGDAEPARQDADHLGLADGGCQHSQPSPLPARALRARQRHAQGQCPHQGRRRDADGQRVPDA